MTQWLKQSTAVTLMIGPFIDDTDGKTAEAAVALTDDNVWFSKNGGAFAKKHETTHPAHDANPGGYYTCLVDATDTDTLGRLRLAVHIAGALPVWQDYMVVTADAWDSMSGAVVIGQAGAQAALVANNLDHLCKTATAGADMTAEVADGTILSRLAGNGDTSTFVPSTDGLRPIATDVAATHAHASTIDGHITADYGATEKTCIDLLDDAAGGLADIHTDIAAIPAAPSANTIADATLDRANAIETGLTLREALRLTLAALAGKLTGAATTTVTIRNAVADSKDRITATVDADGNRTAVTTDVS